MKMRSLRTIDGDAWNFASCCNFAGIRSNVDRPASIGTTVARVGR
jgi:hypothetical protein